MIKVIDGKRYNTETAELVFHYWNGYPSNDFKWRIKKLFVTKKGNWFILHDGGAMTDMAVSAGGNGTCGSSDIEPVSADDAFGFLQANSDDSEAVEAIDKYFADRVQDA